MENDKFKKSYEEKQLTTFAVLKSKFGEKSRDEITIGDLLDAAKINDWEIIKNTLDSGLELDLNTKDNANNNLLIYAFFAGEIEIARILLSHTAQFTVEEFRKVQESLVKENKLNEVKKLLNEYLLKELKSSEKEQGLLILNSIVYQTSLAIQYQQKGFIAEIVNNPLKIPELDREVLDSVNYNNWIVIKALADAIVAGHYESSKWLFKEEKYLSIKDLNEIDLRNDAVSWNYFMHYILEQLQQQQDKLSAAECLGIFKELITMKVNPYNDGDSLLSKFKEVFPKAEEELEDLKSVCANYKVDVVENTSAATSCLVI